MGFSRQAAGGNGSEKVRFCGGANDVAEQSERYRVDGAIVRGDGWRHSQTADSMAALLKMMQFDRAIRSRSEAANSLSRFGTEAIADLVAGFDQEFLDGTSPRIYPWNQSKISNLKSSSPRIYPWGRLQNLKSQISNRMTAMTIGSSPTVSWLGCAIGCRPKLIVKMLYSKSENSCTMFF